MVLEISSKTDRVSSGVKAKSNIEKGFKVNKTSRITFHTAKHDFQHYFQSYYNYLWKMGRMDEEQAVVNS